MACDLLSQAFAAVQAGDLASLRTALDQPGSPALTLQDDSGHSLLQVAASAGQSEVVQELVARGMSPIPIILSPDCSLANLATLMIQVPTQLKSIANKFVPTLPLHRFSFLNNHIPMARERPVRPARPVFPDFHRWVCRCRVQATSTLLPTVTLSPQRHLLDPMG